jgi:hypothetical protein
MRRSFSSLTFAALIAAPIALIACGDDEDTPGGSSAGSKSEAGAGTGATDGGKAGKGGTGNTGGTGNVGGSKPAEGGMPSDGGTPGEGGTAGEGGSGGTGTEPVACDLSGEGKEREELPASIEADLMLDSAIVYQIKDKVKVRPGATLTIPPCTRLEGLAEPLPGFLTVMRGARIVAEGTADAPILFTSSQPEGDREVGDWGGLVLLGNAPLTGVAAARQEVFEGLSADDDFIFGGDDPDDDSGVLRYVRIEFSGFEIADGKEVNGLSMAAVGAGTTIDHIMVSNTKDDCFEWWGGTVKADYLVANNCGDDYFDGDSGWQGGGSYWFGRRKSEFVDSSDPNGFEQDSQVDGSEPRTDFTFENVTLCGTGEPSGQTSPSFGMVLRELVTGSIDNLALLGFEYGIDTRNAFAAGDVTIENSKIWELVETLGAADGTDNDMGFDDASIFTDEASNEADPDPAPFTLEQCLATGAPAAAVINSEIGAFPDAAAVSAWKLNGKWVDWSEE